MSKIALSGNASGTGTFTFAAPNTNTDRTLTLPDSSGTMSTAESTLSQFNASGSAPVYACRAWVNFDGTGTPAIRASGNVSSITDNGTGDYTVNFTTAMQDANYAVVGTTVGVTGTTRSGNVLGHYSLAAGSVGIRTQLGASDTAVGAPTDLTVNTVAIFR
jgi:hypothetical protein